jgi:hypothetical protein
MFASRLLPIVICMLSLARFSSAIELARAWGTSFESTSEKRRADYARMGVKNVDEAALESEVFADLQRELEKVYLARLWDRTKPEDRVLPFARFEREQWPSLRQGALQMKEALEPLRQFLRRYEDSGLSPEEFYKQAGAEGPFKSLDAWLRYLESNPKAITTLENQLAIPTDRTEDCWKWLQAEPFLQYGYFSAAFAERRLTQGYPELAPAIAFDRFLEKARARGKAKTAEEEGMEAAQDQGAMIRYLTSLFVSSEFAAEATFADKATEKRWKEYIVARLEHPPVAMPAELRVVTDDVLKKIQNAPSPSTTPGQ